MFEVKIKQGQGQKSWLCINSALKDFELQTKEEIVFAQRMFVHDAYVYVYYFSLLMFGFIICPILQAVLAQSVLDCYRNVVERNRAKCIYLVWSGLCLRCFVHPPPRRRMSFHRSILFCMKDASWILLCYIKQRCFHAWVNQHFTFGVLKSLSSFLWISLAASSVTARDFARWSNTIWWLMHAVCAQPVVCRNTIHTMKGEAHK